MAAGCCDVSLAVHQVGMRRKRVVRQPPQPVFQGDPLAVVDQCGRAVGDDPGGAVGIAYLEIEGNRLVVATRLK